MHTYINEENGWKLETLRDDSDRDYQNSTQTNYGLIETKLKGCCFFKQVKQNSDYAAEIRYEEKFHNQFVEVLGIVFRHEEAAENTESDILYLRKRSFEGEKCKSLAADYADRLKKTIDGCFFD